MKPSEAYIKKHFPPSAERFWTNNMLTAWVFPDLLRIVKLEAIQDRAIIMTISEIEELNKLKEEHGL